MDWLHALQSEATQLGPWSYLILLFLVAVEGPIATLFGAAAASAQVMKWQWVFVAAAVGNLTADSLWYSLGYVGRIDLVYRLSRWIGVRPQQGEAGGRPTAQQRDQGAGYGQVDRRVRHSFAHRRGVAQDPVAAVVCPCAAGRNDLTVRSGLLGLPRCTMDRGPDRTGLQIERLLVGGILFVLIVFHLIRQQRKD
ncbi:MAG: hypothetical protein R2873_29420 [Caldilineaceae bacterium]